MAFSGGKAATPKLLYNQPRKPQLASTFHRCPQEGILGRTYSSRLSLENFFENIYEVFHILAAHLYYYPSAVITTSPYWLSGVNPARQVWAERLIILIRILKMLLARCTSPPNSYASGLMLHLQ